MSREMERETRRKISQTGGFEGPRSFSEAYGDGHIWPGHVVIEENIFFLGYDDGMLEYVPQKEIVEKVCWFIRKYRPDAVFTMDPGDRWVKWHKTDHRASALLTLDGARAAAYHLYFPHHRYCCLSVGSWPGPLPRLGLSSVYAA